MDTAQWRNLGQPTDLRPLMLARAVASGITRTVEQLGLLPVDRTATRADDARTPSRRVIRSLADAQVATGWQHTTQHQPQRAVGGDG